MSADRRTKASLQETIPSRVAEVEPLCLRLREWLLRHGQANAFAVEVVARESLLNAIIHGNRFCADKTVELLVRFGRNWIRLCVTDHGHGFAWQSQPEFPDECSVHGRGLAIYRRYAQRIRFNPAGNRVTLWIKR